MRRLGVQGRVVVRVCPVVHSGHAQPLGASLIVPERDQCLKIGRMQPKPEALRSFLCKARARCMSGAYVLAGTIVEMASQNYTEALEIRGFFRLS
jgi:hypothetical protein